MALDENIKKSGKRKNTLADTIIEYLCRILLAGMVGGQYPQNLWTSDCEG